MKVTLTVTRLEQLRQLFEKKDAPALFKAALAYAADLYAEEKHPVNISVFSSFVAIAYGAPLRLAAYTIGDFGDAFNRALKLRLHGGSDADMAKDFLNRLAKVLYNQYGKREVRNNG
jgi:hypothetical protein